MGAELRLRRAATGAAVLLLHILLLLALLAAFRPQTFFGEGGRPREIAISLPVAAPRRTRVEPANAVPPPTFLSPEISPRAITPPSFQAAPAQEPKPEQPEGDIRALGRYLTNCSGAYYEQLSPREKQHCLENKFNGQEGPSLTLGPAKPSPFDSVIAKRNEKAVPIERPCVADKPTANLGMPCYDFSGAHQPLVEFHR